MTFHSIFILLIFLVFTISTQDTDFDYSWFNSKCDPSCIFKQYSMDTESLKYFPTNCSEVCAYLQIDVSSNVTESQLTEAFKNVKTLYGFVKISKSNFTSLEFFENLEHLECEPGESLKLDYNSLMTEIGMQKLKSTTCNVVISYSPLMTRFNLPSLKNFNSTYQLKFDTSYLFSANFCMSVEEITNFCSESNLEFFPPPGSYCSPQNSTVYGERICEIPSNTTLESLDSNCQRLLGTLVLRSGDENLVWKLKNVTWIYGRVVIEDTNLTAVDFFDNLQYLVLMEKNISLFQALRNRNLANATFPKLRKLIAPTLFSPSPMIFLGNHENLRLNSSICSEIMTNSDTWQWHFLEIDKKRCEEIQEELMIIHGTGGGSRHSNFLALVFVTLIFIFN